MQAFSPREIVSELDRYIIGQDVDLSEADLSGADLSGADLSGMNLSNTNLTDADLTETDLTNVNLSNAILTNVSGLLSEATRIRLPSGYTLEGLFIKPDADNDGLSDELEIAINGDATSVDSTTFATALTNLTADTDNDGVPDELEIAISGDATSVDSTAFATTLANLTADADNDGVPDDYETAAGGDTTSSTFESVLLMLTVNKNVPAMGGIGLLALGLSILGLGAVRLRK